MTKEEIDAAVKEHVQELARLTNEIAKLTNSPAVLTRIEIIDICGISQARCSITPASVKEEGGMTDKPASEIVEEVLAALKKNQGGDPEKK
jgi:hypothetical protein